MQSESEQKVVKFPNVRDIRALLRNPEADRQERDRVAIDDAEEFRGAFGFRGLFWSSRRARSQAIALKQRLQIGDEDFCRLAKASAFSASPWGIHEWPGRLVAAYGYFFCAILLVPGLFSVAYAAAAPASPHDLVRGCIYVVAMVGSAATIVWWHTVRPWRIYRAAVPPGALAAAQPIRDQNRHS